MSKAYYFAESINFPSVQGLVDKLDSLPGKVDLFFETDGGYTDVMDYLIHYLNNRKDEITIYLIGELVSAGTKILTDFKGKIKIHEGLDFILFHKWDRKVHLLRKQSSVDNAILLKNTEIENQKFSKKLEKLGLTKKQLKTYNKGKDVVIYKQDFNQLKISK